MSRDEWLEPFLRISDPAVTITPNADLTNETSMKMRATARAVAKVESPQALKKVLLESRTSRVPAFVLGGGKNTLFATSHFEGLVMKLGRGFGGLEMVGANTIRAGGSVALPSLVRYTHSVGMMGLEFLTMVPGTVGGSVAGNAGAGGYGLCDYVDRVYLMTRDGFIASVGRNEFRHSYRHSELREAVVLVADFRLERFNPAEATQRMDSYKEKKKGQPYSLPSSGCIFKNPKIAPDRTISAGMLIDQCGLKGYRINSAVVSEEHANFIVNTGSSSGEDFLALIALVKDRVKAKTGFDLHVEVQIVGGPLGNTMLQ